MRYLHFASAFFFFFLPVAAYAQVSITEIMYDLEGTDSAREWIEIQNTSGAAIDLSSWKLFENDTNHGLTAFQGSGSVSAGGYAIIADNASQFQADHPGFSGALFDSSFSLKNTGEVISIRSADGIDVDSVTYSSDWGAAGDGNSLQLVAGSWRAAAPTPGAFNHSTPVPPSSSDSSATTGSSAPSPSSSSGGSPSNNAAPPKEKPPEFITADAGGDRVTVVGAAEFFEGKAYTKGGQMHQYATYRWNFGNGKVVEGKRVLHQYDFPGTYVVLLSAVTADKLAATDRVMVEAKPAALAVTAVTPQLVEVTNGSDREINLSLWSLRAGTQFFQFPEGTVVVAHGVLSFSSSITGLDTNVTRDVALLYPNGQTAHQFGTNPATQTITTNEVPPVAATAASAAVAPPRVPVGQPTLLETVRAPEERTAALAAVGAAEALGSTTEGGGMLPYLLGLSALLLVAVGGLLFVRHRDGSQSEADEYEIIDESDEM